MNQPNRTLALPVRDFVTPVEPSGDLNFAAGLGAADDARHEGTAAHTRIQKRLQQEYEGYQKEISLSHTISIDNLTLLVRGKLDGLFPETELSPPTIEEIKSSMQVEALQYAIERDPTHPYILQTYAYAWLYQKNFGVTPRCRLRIVSLLDESEVEIALEYNSTDFESWVARQCKAIAAREAEEEARRSARHTVALQFAFPFDAPRPGQSELMETVRLAITRGEQLLIQAPTGLGKTAAILYPTLEIALSKDKRVFYATPRNSQHRVAEDFVRRLRANNIDIASVTLRAKEKMCPKSEVDCRAERCEFAQGYYDRLKSSRALEILRETGCATSDLIHKLGIDLTLCPFELSLDATHRADVIICDYNYVLAPRATMVRHFGTPEKAAEALVVVDEAHNLQSRACGWFSPTISHQQLSELNPRESALEEKKLRARLARLHKELRRMLEALEGEERLLESNTADLLSLERRLGQLLVDAQSQGERLPPGDTAVRLFRLVFDFAEAFRNWGPQFFSTWKPNFGGGQWEIVCADASTHLRERLAPLPAFVAFSATLKPFEFHATLLGLDTAKLQTAEFLSPFPRDHRKLLVVPQISTAWRDRERSIPQIAETISRLLPLRLGNYIVFFPSFDFMSRVLDNVVLPSFEILTQPRGASTADIDALLGALNERRNIALFAVQGGSLAEGIDCPGDSLIGTVVVGPPLPTYDVGREAMRDYYQKTYGRGQEYAYIYPAMARAVQAAGRVIRGPDDRGLILLLDKRFLRGEFARCMPVDWYYDSPKELVSQGLLHDISNFWDGTHVP